MIGLVLVSHSAALAAGVRELAGQMTGGKVRIAVAGGIDDAENPIGTDPMRVHAAIEEVYTDDGVIVLMDLGSALMSAEMALEFLDPAQSKNVRLCEAPFVEGALAAAVQASAGSSLSDVLAEARAALTAKQQHLAPALKNAPAPETTDPTTPGADATTLQITVPNKLGLHARPAARLVGLVSQYDAALTIQKNGRMVNARNISQVTLLDARHGDDLTFFAEGTDADTLLQAVQSLVDDNFGDSDNETEAVPEEAPPATDAPNGALAGVGAARGLAIGTVYQLGEEPPELPDSPIDDVAAEITRFQNAVAAASDDLSALVEQSARRIGNERAAIFDAHRVILADETLLDETTANIREKQPAESAWWTVIQATAQAYRDSDNPYIQGRAADVIDVGKRVLRHLMPDASPSSQIPAGSVLVAPDLSPSDTAQLDPAQVVGIITGYGGATSHTAIIARGLGIPAVVGLGAALAQLPNRVPVVVDGTHGHVYADPTAQQRQNFEAQIATQREKEAQLLAASREQAITQDEHRVEVTANIGVATDTDRLLEFGAEGVGLFRTELLFMDQPTAPDEDTQAAAYTHAVKQLDGCPMIIRTLDVGGDKAISYIDIAPEENPFLGHRGIRYWLSNEPLARTQLRAICRASAAGPVRVMFPMVGTLDELQAACALVADVQAKLAAEGTDYDAEMPIGIMVEVPSAVLLADTLAQHVDFFSIGTNDLTQYLMAADRGNARVNALATPFQPSVLRAIQQVVEAAHAQDKWVGMCGEMAGNPTATALLVGLGLDELSMSAPSIPQVKANIRGMRYDKVQSIAAHALSLETADAVRHYLEELTPDVTE